MYHVCWLWCVTPESNYECQTTCQLLPPANLGLTKWIKQHTLKNTEYFSSILIIDGMLFCGGIRLCHNHMTLMWVISTGCFTPAAVCIT